MSYNMPSGPPPPRDPYLRETIEKMANFVARNGPSVEETTRQKQAGNDKFSFLYDSDPYNMYYRYRVDMERAQLETHRIYEQHNRQGGHMGGGPGPEHGRPAHMGGPGPEQHGRSAHMGGPGPEQHGRPPHMGGGPSMPPKRPEFNIQQAHQQISQLQVSIQQSEQNLQAQRDAIPLITEAQFLQAMLDAENGKIARLLQQVNLDVTPLANLMEQLNGKASKDAVASCKKWILDNCPTDQMREIVLMYLLHRVRETTSNDSFRIHILYLINDWAHYCHRKKLDGQKQMLSRYVPKMYAWVSESAQDRAAVTEKIEKLVGMWEGQGYFSDHCFKQLRNPQQIFLTEQATLYGEHAKLKQNIDAQLMAMLAGYEAQHNEFCSHQVQQIAMLEKQIDIAERPEGPKSLLDLEIEPPTGPEKAFPERRRSRFDQVSPASKSHSNSRFFGSDVGPGGGGPGGGRRNRFSSNQNQMYEEYPEPEPPVHGGENVDDDEDIDGTEYKEEDLIPKCEYWDTPAALMKARIDIHDFTYKPMDPKAIRLEPPMKPSPALRHALQMFYAEGPDMPQRDEQGWEAGALAAFFERKMHMRDIQLDKAKAEGKTLEDLITNRMTQQEIDEELRERERARIEARQAVLKQQEKEAKGGAARSRSSSSSSSSSTESSRASSRSSSRGRGRNRNRKRSRTRSLSRSPPRRGGPSRGRRSRSESRSRSRSSSPSPRFRRSPTPEEFIPPLSAYRQQQQPGPARPLGLENKGAMLMQKMGWKGTGLGANETGIQEPISAGEARDRGDQFRGLGQSTDMFEEYRKQLSTGYHSRNARVFEKRAHRGGRGGDD